MLKSPKLTKREERIRYYILQEHYRQIKLAIEADPDDKYSVGRLNEVENILGKLRDIWGG